MKRTTPYQGIIVYQEYTCQVFYLNFVLYVRSNNIHIFKVDCKWTFINKWIAVSDVMPCKEKMHEFIYMLEGNTYFFPSNHWFLSNQPSEVKVLSNFQSSIILQEATRKIQFRVIFVILQAKSLQQYRSFTTVHRLQTL